MKLYELASQYQELIPLAENADDEADLQAFYDTLDGLQGEIGEKLENCAAVVKTIDAEAEAIAAEEKRLATRRRALQNSADRLKAYMRDGMDAAQMVKHKGKLFTISLQDNPPAVVVDDEASLPRDYCRVKVEPDKTAIKDALKNGVEVPGVHLEHTKSLRIR